MTPVRTSHHEKEKEDEEMIERERERERETDRQTDRETMPNACICNLIFEIMHIYK